MKDVSLPLAGLRTHLGLLDIIRFLCEKEGLSKSFWTKHIDPLLSIDASYRSSLAFIVISQLLAHLPSKERNANINSFISPNFIQVSLHTLKKRNESTDEDRIILGIYENIFKVAEEVPESRESLLKSLLTGTGAVNFDKLSGGSLVARISALCSKETVVSLGGIYKEAVITSGGGNPKLSHQERLFALQQFAKLTSHPAVLGDVEWKVESLKFLLSAAILPFNKKTPVQWNSVTRAQAKNAFFKGLDMKEKSFDNTCSILLKTLLFVSKEIKKGETLSEEHKKIWSKMMDVVKDMSYESNKKISVFLVLFAHMGFQLLQAPELAIDALNDLHVCYEKATGDQEEVSSSKDSSEEEEEPKWVEVIVDILLSLLSQNRSILRQVVNSVFLLICPSLTSKGLQMIVDVVNPPSAEKEDSEDEMEEGEEGMEIEAQSGGESSSSESEDESDEEEVNDAIRNDVKSALGDFAADSDTGSINPDDMDEEDMKKIDEALAGVFKALSNRKSSSQKRKEKKESIAQSHFKIRVLELIDLYISRSTVPVSHIIYLISPLLSTLESALKTHKPQGDTQSLIICVKNTLKKISGLKKLNMDEDLDRSSLVGILKMFVGLANKGSSLVQQLNHPTPVFSKLCCFILTVVESTKDDALMKKALSVYEKSLQDYFCQSHCLLPCNFFSLPISQRHGEGFWSLAPKIMEHTFDKKTRQFRRIQGLMLLMTYIKSSSSTSPEESSSKVKELIQSLIQNIIVFYNSDVISGSVSKFICESLSSLKALYTSKALRGEVPWDKVKASLEGLRSKIPGFKGYSDLRKAFNGISSPLGIKALVPSDKGQRVKGDEESMMEIDLEDSSKKKKTKKKKGHAKKATLISRKQKKAFELDGQFKGEEIPSFKGINSKQRSKFMHDLVQS
eukprot:TRINITY_DN4464_c0_g1_i1.p1 TRINITY_DN4464_c0_g1~~TRINITY_DN4464_c0_g1_i1.p1  ORF type:complete len:905 (+),score=259.48 TRINITY_DN4464_c0_g1_i1:419-3133(+)